MRSCMPLNGFHRERASFLSLQMAPSSNLDSWPFLASARSTPHQPTTTPHPDAHTHVVRAMQTILSWVKQKLATW